MKEFNDINNCIHYSKIGIDYFPLIKEITFANDFIFWDRKLSSLPNPNTFLFSETSKLNFLSLSILIGFSIKEKFDDPLFAHYKRLFKKLEIYLEVFPELKSDKSFKNKIKNIEGLNFLSTLSELSLAYKLKEYGLKVKFESKFKHLLTGKLKDIDLSITDKDNNQIHLEVYMPNKQITESGFLDLSQDNIHFNRKINLKMIDKFGNDGVIGLNGKILLAINKAFFDLLHIKSLLPTFKNNYTDLLTFIPSGINGLLIYDDDFGTENSFRFEKILLK